MLCPHCRSRNPLGSRRCRACHQPFTRGAMERAAQFATPVGPAATPAQRADWTAAHDEWAERARTPGRRQSNGCAEGQGHRADRQRVVGKYPLELRLRALCAVLHRLCHVAGSLTRAADHLRS